MDSATHALGDRRKTLSQSVEVDQRGHKRWYLDVGASDKGANEQLNRRQRRIESI